MHARDEPAMPGSGLGGFRTFIFIWVGQTISLVGSSLTGFALISLFTALSGVVLFTAGFPPRIWILGTAAFLYFFSRPIINGCSQAIWLSKTAPDVQGREFAVLAAYLHPRVRNVDTELPEYAGSPRTLAPR